jgi:hypothetical protein
MLSIQAYLVAHNNKGVSFTFNFSEKGSGDHLLLLHHVEITRNPKKMLYFIPNSAFGFLLHVLVMFCKTQTVHYEARTH